MPARSERWKKPTSTGLPSAISSQALVFGLLHSSRQDGEINPFGQARVHASHSAPQGSAKALKMKGISGPTLRVLSESNDLSRSLANRLRMAQEETGSILFRVTWSEQVTPLGRLLPSQQASGLRTSGEGSTSVQLRMDLAGWGTAVKGDNYKLRAETQGRLGSQVRLTLAPWPTPLSRDWKGPQGRAYRGKAADLPTIAEKSRKDVQLVGPIERGPKGKGFWEDCEWVVCRPDKPNGKHKRRPIEPGSFPLVDGAATVVGPGLRGYGNALCAPQAEAFVKALKEVLRYDDCR